MRFVLAITCLLFTASAFAQSDAGTTPSGASVRPAEPVLEGEAPQEIVLPEPGAYFRWQPPAPVGACLGGDCAPVPSVVARPVAEPSEDAPPVNRRMRFAYTGAVLGAVSAGLVLGSSIAIASVDDLHSERITRGVWLGYFALSTGVVALSSALARRELGGTSESGRGSRNVAWSAFAIALADGAILWAGSFQGFPNMDVLTIGAGVIGTVALLPHALDAWLAGRGLRSRHMVSLEPAANGLRVRF